MHPEGRRILKLLREVFPPAPAHPLPLVREDTFRDYEVQAVEEAFSAKDHWPSLASEFLDNVPDGWASAPAFLSDQAMSFFLPAYLSADLQGELTRVDPVSWLISGLDGSYRSLHAKKGRTTPKEEAVKRWRFLTPDQRAAVAAYLRLRQQQDVFAEEIEAALQSFWEMRVEG
jgi:hypothetical protein